MDDRVGRVEDWSARGFVDASPDPLRYSASARAQWETTGYLCERVPNGARVLDIGCGTGSVSQLIKQECNADVVGIEPDSRRAEACHKRGLTVECGYYDEERARRLGEFDVILFVDVLEHVPDPVALLELARCYLKPGGRIIASIPNVAHWTVRLALLRGEFRYAPMGIMDATHLRWFTIDTIRRVFHAARLQITEYDWSSGEWLDVYKHRPWTFIPANRRAGALRRLVRARPGLFACQHVVTAQCLIDEKTNA